MPIGITEDHVALQESVRGWVERHCPPSVTRAGLDEPSRVPAAVLGRPRRAGLAGPGRPRGRRGLGLRRPARSSWCVEELGRACAPGPGARRRCWRSKSCGRARTTTRAARCCPSSRMARAWARSSATPRRGCEARGPTPDSSCEGTASPVLGAHLADLVVAPVDVANEGGGSDEVWVALEVGDGVTARELPSVDLTRRVAEVAVDRTVDAAHVLTGVTGAQVARRVGRVARRRARRASRSGASRPRRRTPRTACSSAVRSASSRA